MTEKVGACSWEECETSEAGGRGLGGGADFMNEERLGAASRLCTYHTDAKDTRQPD